MKQILNNIKGDKGIWALVVLLAFLSFMPVYSASTNLVYVIGKGTTFGYLAKHFVHLFIGFCVMYFVHKTPYHYFKLFSKVLLPAVGVLLLYTLLQGKMISGASASRWITIPIVGFSFQPSAFATVFLMLYVATYLSKVKDKVFSFKASFIELWVPVFGILALILPSNFSTTALLFLMVCMVVYVGQYPLKYLLSTIGIAFAGIALFFLLAKAFPENKLFSRVRTWEGRITRFTQDSPDEDVYQIENAKIAIAAGGLYGLGPGRSVQKNFLPQSSSDFIFAIIVEEWGLVGGLGLMIIYLFLFFRFIVCAYKAKSFYGKLLVVGLGFPIIFQAMINMGVAVELLPTTGQTLPLISSGGTSIWVTCFAIGVILSVSKKEEEIIADLEEKEKRNEALQRIIDREIAIDEEYESEEEETENPMQPILKAT